MSLVYRPRVVGVYPREKDLRLDSGPPSADSGPSEAQPFGLPRLSDAPHFWVLDLELTKDKVLEVIRGARAW